MIKKVISVSLSVFASWKMLRCIFLVVVGPLFFGTGSWSGIFNIPLLSHDSDQSPFPDNVDARDSGVSHLLYLFPVLIHSFVLRDFCGIALLKNRSEGRKHKARHKALKIAGNAYRVLPFIQI